MKNYQKAYEYYQDACQRYEIKSMSLYQFIEHLTKEQLNEYIKQAI